MAKANKLFLNACGFDRAEQVRSALGVPPPECSTNYKRPEYVNMFGEQQKVIRRVLAHNEDLILYLGGIGVIDGAIALTIGEGVSRQAISKRLSKVTPRKQGRVPYVRVLTLSERYRANI